MKKVLIWMILTCVLMLSACAAQEDRNTDMRENGAIGTSDDNNTQEDETEMKKSFGRQPSDYYN